MRRGIDNTLVNTEWRAAGVRANGGAIPAGSRPAARQKHDCEAQPMSSPSEIYSPGLEGVIAGETAISTVTGGLRYRGYPVTELAEKATFDEVAFLLLHGELPTSSQLREFNGRVVAARQVPRPLTELFKSIPKAAPSMDVLRSAVSVMSHFDPD